MSNPAIGVRVLAPMAYQSSIEQVSWNEVTIHQRSFNTYSPSMNCPGLWKDRPRPQPG
jgi:hypothetical protein